MVMKKSGILTYTVEKNNNFSEGCASIVRNTLKQEFAERLSEKSILYTAFNVEHHDTLFVLKVTSLYDIEKMINHIVSIFQDIYEQVVEEQEYNYDEKQITIYYLLSIDNKIFREHFRV